MSNSKARFTLFALYWLMALSFIIMTYAVIVDRSTFFFFKTQANYVAHVATEYEAMNKNMQSDSTAQSNCAAARDALDDFYTSTVTPTIYAGAPIMDHSVAVLVSLVTNEGLWYRGCQTTPQFLAMRKQLMDAAMSDESRGSRNPFYTLVLKIPVFYSQGDGFYSWADAMKALYAPYFSRSRLERNYCIKRAIDSGVHMIRAQKQCAAPNH